MVDEVAFASVDGCLLSGTVVIPDADGPVPGVVLVGGSGPADRHNGGYFDVLSARLVTSGVAILVYDKRGVGRSEGSWVSADVSDLARDAAAALDALAAHPAVAASAVGLFGHSEGGWVALRAAAQLRRPRHLILNSCPAVPFLQAEVTALVNMGVDERTARQALEELAGAAGASAGHRAGERILQRYAGTPLGAVLAEADVTMDAARWSQLRAWRDYDPAPDIARLEVPTLALYGQRDPLTPVEPSVAAFARLHPAARVQVFPDGDHRLLAGDGFAEGYLQTLIRWCSDHRPSGFSHR
jgi:pimeloyl-ACP methyl ester carboxylesterase